MSSAPEVLSLEEVRSLSRVAWVSATALYGPDRDEILGEPGDVVRRLCATVEHYAAEQAKAREDAQKWRALMTEAARSLRDDPDYQAQIERAKREQKEAEEELRLLRAWEQACQRVMECADDPDANYNAALSRQAASWAALVKFRARQQEPRS